MNKKPVIVVGYLGNMGKRYTAILDYLDHPWIGIEDMGVHYDNQMEQQISGLHVQEYHSVLIATPTSTHMDMIKKYKGLNLPILCEKPISYGEEDIDWLFNNNINIAMINQYHYLSGVGGATYYDFYNTGKDSIQWDCINIVGMARQEKAYINNKSPEWNCCINGKRLTIEDVNAAYVDMIREWLGEPKSNLEYIKEAHKKVREGFYEKDTYRHTSQIDKHKTAEQSDHEGRKQSDSGQSDISGNEDSGVHRGQKRSQSKRGATSPRKRPAKQEALSS